MSITLLYGTSNSAKLSSMKDYLEGLDIKIIGLRDIDIPLPDIEEYGNNPLENARIKALAYHEATNMPVFSCDSGLYLKGVPDELQPGIHVRNICMTDGTVKCLSDDEMVEYYSILAENNGGNIRARYLNGICLVMKSGELYEYMGDDIAGNEFIITTKPHPKRNPGFPIDSLSLDIKTGKYFYDLDENKGNSIMDQGFRSFFIRAIYSC